MSFRNRSSYQNPMYLRMQGIERERRKGSDVANAPKSEEAQLKVFKKLPTCHQKAGGPCTYPKFHEEEQRCGLVLSMDVDCPYLGKVEPLKSVVAKKEDDEKKRKPILQPAPKFDV